MMSRARKIKYALREEWIRELKKVRPLMLNENSDVVQTISDVYGFKPLYLLFYKGKDIVVSFIALTKGRRIELPIHFFYSAIWVSPKLNDTAYCQVFTEFLRELKMDFNKISLKLPSYISDIRPFLWTGFNVENRFTYLKNLESLSYAKDVNKNIAKLNAYEFAFKMEKLSPEILELNMKIFYQERGYPNFKIKEIAVLIERLSVSQHLACFSCYLGDKLLVSHILLLDPENRIAYTVLKNRLKEQFPNSVHSILYHQLFSALREQDYGYVDLLGADLENISLFKSRFKPDLYAVDILRYSKINVVLYGIIPFIKKCILRVLMIFKF